MLFGDRVLSCGGVSVFRERIDALPCAKYSCLKLAGLGRKGYLRLNHKHLIHKQKMSFRNDRFRALLLDMLFYFKARLSRTVTPWSHFKAPDLCHLSLTP